MWKTRRVKLRINTHKILLNEIQTPRQKEYVRTLWWQYVVIRSLFNRPWVCVAYEFVFFFFFWNCANAIKSIQWIHCISLSEIRLNRVAWKRLRLKSTYYDNRLGRRRFFISNVPHADNINEHVRIITLRRVLKSLTKVTIHGPNVLSRSVRNIVKYLTAEPCLTRFRISNSENVSIKRVNQTFSRPKYATRTIEYRNPKWNSLTVKKFFR